MTEHPRVRMLVAQFRRVEVAMRDLPIYNEQIAPEAIGFRRFDNEALLGVLPTPWFMNLALIPIAQRPMNMAAIGKTVIVEFPAGSFRIKGTTSSASTARIPFIRRC